MNDLDEWVVFQVFPERSAAAALASRLEAGDCPAKFEARALGNAVETDYCVYVPKYLAHRARWILAQLPVTDEELDFLATGKLPGQEEK